MTRRSIVLVAAMMALAACHKRPVDAVQPEDEAAAQARTSAKALADIAAAEEAARAPLGPDTTPPPPSAAPAPKHKRQTSADAGQDDASDAVAPPAESNSASQ